MRRGQPVSILLLADDMPSRQTLAGELREYEFSVTAAVPQDIDELLAGAEHDITILDTQLRGRRYEDVLGAISSRIPGHPVILIGHDAAVTDRVRGLNAGAVDFLVAPLSVRELAARIRSRIRFDRLEHAQLRYGELIIDFTDHSVRYRGAPLRLSNLEFRLLAYFVRNVGDARSRVEILNDVWVEERSVRSNAVDVYVGYLRRKLQGYQLPLTTVRGVGYRLEPPAPEAPPADAGAAQPVGSRT
jgi:DNA-binding response OmpR family regulator